MAYPRPYRSEAERVAALPEFLHSYNHHRGHTALKGHSPASRVCWGEHPGGLDLVASFPTGHSRRHHGQRGRRSPREWWALRLISMPTGHPLVRATVSLLLVLSILAMDSSER